MVWTSKALKIDDIVPRLLQNANVQHLLASNLNMIMQVTVLMYAILCSAVNGEAKCFQAEFAVE